MINILGGVERTRASPRKLRFHIGKQQSAPSSGGVIDLFGAGRGRDIRQTAQAYAKEAFRDISKALGRVEAERIFLDIATPISREWREDLNNCMLLQVYISSGGWPRWSIDALALHLAKVNKTLPAQQRFGTRGSRPITKAKIKKQLIAGVKKKRQAGIAKQLRRLLDNGPPKTASPALRMLVEEARQLPRSRRGPKRKKLGPNEIKPISALE